MSDFLLSLVGGLISFLFFDILFSALNQSMLRLFIPIQIKISAIKNPKILKFILNVIAIMMSSYWFTSLKLSSLFFGIILGFFMSLINIIFSESITMQIKKKD